MRSLSPPVATVAVLALITLGCGNCGLNAGRKAAKVVPALEKVNEDYATEPVDCGEDYPTPTPRNNGIMGTIECGGEVEGNNRKGNMNWGDDFYQKAFCTPQRNDYEDSPEAVYELIVPANVQAEVQLTTDCVDLDLVSVGWQDTKDVPLLKHHNRIRECEFDDKPGSGHLTLLTVDRAQRFLIGVDGKYGEVGNFRLSVKCSTYR